MLVLLVLMGLGSLLFRTWWQVEKEMARAQEARQKGAYESAIIHYEKVILWKFPLDFYAREAREKIEKLGGISPFLGAYARDALAFSLSSTGEKLKGGLPDRFWSALMGVTLLIWTALAFLSINSVFDRDLKIKRGTHLLVFTLSFILFLSLWVYSLHRL